MTNEETETLMEKMIEVITQAFKNDPELSKLSVKDYAYLLTLSSASLCSSLIDEIQDQ